MMYSQIDPEGYISLSQFTENPEAIVPEGYRLLPDNIPQPPEYDPYFFIPERIEPIPGDATEVPYRIIPLVRTPREHEVIL